MFLLATLFASLVLTATANSMGAPKCDMVWPAVGQASEQIMNVVFEGEKTDKFTIAHTKDAGMDKIMLTAVGDGNILGYLAAAWEEGKNAMTGGTFSGESGKQPDGSGCGAGWYTHKAAVGATSTAIMFAPEAVEKTYNIQVWALVGPAGTRADQRFYMAQVKVGPPPAAGGTTTTVAGGTTTTADAGSTTSSGAPGATTTSAPASGAGDGDDCTTCVTAGKTWCVVGLTRETDNGSCKENAEACGTAADKVGEAITDAKMCIKDLNDDCEEALVGDDNLAKCNACIAKPGCGVCSTAGAVAGAIGVGDHLAGLSCSYIGGEDDKCISKVSPLTTAAECAPASAVLLSGLAVVAALFSQF